MEMSSSVVIKVKYGDVLRRINARVVDGKLEFSFDGLREKVSSIFDFPKEAELELTYVDEDNDDVTLAEDGDLTDVVRQGLDPIRITVRLNTRKSEIMGGFPDTLKAGQVLRDARASPMDKLFGSFGAAVTTNVASKLTTSALGVAGMLDNLSKKGLEHLITKPKEQRSSQGDVPESSKAAAVIKGLGQSESDATPMEVQASEEHTSSKKTLNESVVDISKWNCVHASSSSKTLGTDTVRLSVGSKSTTTNTGKKNAVMKSSSGLPEENSKTTVPLFFPRRPGGPPVVHIPPPPPRFYQNPTYVKSIGGMAGARPQPLSNHVPCLGPIRYVGSPFPDHHGVRCDGCDIIPIGGPIFKSKLKDHNLCNFCIHEMGKPEDYIRVDYPAANSTIKSPKELFNYALHPYQHVSPHRAQGGEHLGASSSSSGVCLLDSCFIQDITIFDGTFMAPLTPFTKIWRLRNNGKVMWPEKTRLVWIGGDRLCKDFSFEVDIPKAGIQVDQVLDVAVDFIAPELPGQYVSYWRMRSPSGEEFGQHVWVIIQVDASLKETGHDAANGFDLNSPPVRNNADGPAVNLPLPDNSVKMAGSGQHINLRQPHRARTVNPLVGPEVHAAARTFPLPPPDLLNPWSHPAPRSPLAPIGPWSTQLNFQTRLEMERERLLKKEQRGEHELDH